MSVEGSRSKGSDIRLLYIDQPSDTSTKNFFLQTEYWQFFFIYQNAEDWINQSHTKIWQVVGSYPPSISLSFNPFKYPSSLNMKDTIPKGEKGRRDSKEIL